MSDSKSDTPRLSAEDGGHLEAAADVHSDREEGRVALPGLDIAGEHHVGERREAEKWKCLRETGGGRCAVEFSL